MTSRFNGTMPFKEGCMGQNIAGVSAGEKTLMEIPPES
jgi:hypothetical protein